MNRVSATKRNVRSLSCKLIRTPSPRSPNHSPVNSPRDLSSELRGPALSPSRNFPTRKLKLLGRGPVTGTEVWKVKIEGWTCCAKIIDLTSTKASDIEAFEAEIETLQKLPSLNKHIVQYLGYQRSDNHLEVYMTLYEGCLNELIALKKKYNSSFGSRQIAEISYQLLSALVVLHSDVRKLIHRDIKSDNIFYENTADGVSYILGDFGLSKVLLTSKTSTIVGTNRWIAPEVLYGGEYSFPADMWSFGMLMYELMTLDVPYHEIRGFGVEKRIVEGVLPVLTGDQEKEYACLINIWHGCLSYDPNERLTAAKALFLVKILLDENLV